MRFQKEDGMNIAHFETSLNMGGQELRILEQIQWLLRKNHSAWLLARGDCAIYKEAVKRGLPVYPIPFRGSVNPTAIFELVRLVRREKIDIVDCHSCTAVSTAMWVRMLGIPVVRTLHVYAFRRDLTHKYLWRYGTDHVIVVSRGIAEHLQKTGFADKDKISVIPTGIDLNRFRPDVDGGSVRRELHISDSTRVISIIAMIRPDKGHPCFLRAVDAIADAWPDVRFLIVGSATKPAYWEDTKKEIEALRHREKVILTGFRDDVENVIAASDVIVNASPLEPRSQVIHQAFAMKKLVVASNKGGNQDSISDGKTGFLFRSEDAGSLSQTILSVMDHETSRIRERAYNRALSDYSDHTMMVRTLRVYRDALQTGKALQSQLHGVPYSLARNHSGARRY